MRQPPRRSWWVLGRMVVYDPTYGWIDPVPSPPTPLRFLVGCSREVALAAAEAERARGRIAVEVVMDATNLIPGPGWRRPAAEHRKAFAVATCPLCGREIVLCRPEYGVAGDGLIDEPIMCPNETCGFCDWVRLVGWREATHAVR